MIEYSFKSSFEKSIKSLSGKDRKIINKLFDDLIEILAQKKPLPKGVGLTNLRKDFWEIRKGLKQRIMFEWKGNNLKFVLAGNHDQIKKFLKNIK